ncbi:hypothetical protein T484DRAFT_1845213 [Baffinella frigidus]|nr:hypothetical protein T484DRAFT_1845213 [Cryptophyta sp. CCMP2293]
MFTDKAYQALIRAWGTPEARDTATILETVGAWYAVFQTKGLTEAAHFIALYDEVIPRRTVLEEEAPGGNVLGIPRRLWFAMRADLDTLQQFRACYPDATIIEAYLDTYDLEGAFADLVRRCGGKKPDLVSAMGASRSCDILSKIRHFPNRGFVMGISRRAAYDNALVGQELSAATLGTWRGVDVPRDPITPHRNYNGKRAKLPKLGRSVYIPTRAYHKKPEG